MKLSLIIPVYNFEKRLRESIAELNSFFVDIQSRGIGQNEIEVIFVNDGSTDASASILKTQSAPFRVIHLDTNQGKGAAIKAGVVAAQGDFIFFTDADIPYDLHAIETALVEFEKGADIVSGSRYVAGSSSTKPRTLTRRLGSMVFSTLANIVLLRRIADTQCGFKGFRKDVAKRLFATITSTGFIFDVEMFYEAQKAGMRIAFVPVLLIDDTDSSISMFSDSIRMAVNVLKLFARTRKQEIHQFLRYGLTGIFNTLLNLAVFNLLMTATSIYSGSWVTLFSLISFAVVITVAFFINSSWVFKRKDRMTYDGYRKFFIVSGSVALVNVLFIHIAVNVIGPLFGINAHLWANIASISTIAISVVGNYLGYKFFVFT